MRHTVVRAGAALLSLSAAGALAGCAVLDSLTGAAATPTPTVTVAGGSDLGFDADADLDPSDTVQWTDPFVSDSSFEVYRSDDGNGSWSYLDTATQCIVGFWQGMVSDLAAADGDSALSDELLASQFGEASAADIAPYANDDLTFSSLQGTIAARSVAGADSDSGETYIVAARAFGVLGEGLVATLDCPSGVDVYDQWQALSTDPGAFTAVIGDFG